MDKKLNICMVSDFFYPVLGGVEKHIYHLSESLIKRGHRVIVVTRDLKDYRGVILFKNNLKVYYLPTYKVAKDISLATIFSTLITLRSIWIREGIEIVHAHQTLSSIGHEAILHARVMGLKACFTDHSLMEISSIDGILVNKLLEFTLSDIMGVISVSDAGRKNIILRTGIDPKISYAIPNAISAESLKPKKKERKQNDRIIIVILCRHVFRKGIGLLIKVIPEICDKFPDVDFLIGGDGPKKADLEVMIQNNDLEDRVVLFGECKHDEVGDFLVKGDIFLNTSLTDSFCMAILEAACCNLPVVSTNVGGIPEVLPPYMIELAYPNKYSIITVLSKVIKKAKTCNFNYNFHDTLKEMYSWEKAAIRTEKFYEDCIRRKPSSLLGRIFKAYACGPYFGIIFSYIIISHFIFYKIVCALIPIKTIKREAKRNS